MAVYEEKKLILPYRRREFYNLVLWKTFGDSSRDKLKLAMIASLPTRRPENLSSNAAKNSVEGKYSSFTKLRRISNNETELQYFLQIDLGGSSAAVMPKEIIHKSASRKIDSNVAHVQKYFLQQITLGEVDEQDGASLANAFMTRASSSLLSSSSLYELKEEGKSERDVSSVCCKVGFSSKTALLTQSP